MIRALVSGLLLLALGSRTCRADLVGFAVDAPTASAINAIGSVSGTTHNTAFAIWPDASTTVDALLVSVATAPGGGKSWTITVEISDTSGTPIWADAGFSCVIANTATFCLAPVHSATWPQDALLSFKITPAGSPTTARMQGALRSNGTSTVRWEGMAIPTTGNAVAAGSATVAGTTDNYFAMLPIEGTFGSLLSRLTCRCNQPMGTGNSLNLRVRHWQGSWFNAAVVCSVSGTLATGCQDLANTESIGGSAPDGLSMALTVTGIIPAGTVCACGCVFVF